MILFINPVKYQFVEKFSFATFKQPFATCGQLVGQHWSITSLEQKCPKIDNLN